MQHGNLPYWTSNQRRVRGSTDLFAVCLVAMIAIVATALDLPPFIRLPFAIPFVLFIPGYCLVALLFPSIQGVDNLERFALSFGLSMALVAPVALGINLLPWGITTATILFGLGMVVAVCAYFASVRRRRLPPDQRFVLRLERVRLPAVGNLSTRQTALVLTAICALGVAGIAKAIDARMTPDPYTEFALLSADGTATDLPRDLTAGDVETVTVSIANHEHASRTYLVRVSGDGRLPGEPIVVALATGEQWVHPVQFIASEPASTAVVKFELRRSGIDDDSDPPYRVLELQVTVAKATPVADVPEMGRFA